MSAEDEKQSVARSAYLQNALDHLLIDMCHGDHAGDTDTTRLSLLEVYIRRRPVQPHAHCFQLSCQDLLMCPRFSSVQNHQQQICRLAHGNDLTTTTFTLRGTLNNTWQIQELNLGVVVVNDTRNTCQCCELIGCCL